MTWRVEQIRNNVLISLVSFQTKSEAKQYVEQIKRESIRDETYDDINMFEVI